MASITIIGSGNTASALSKALYRAGHRIDTVISRNISNAQLLAGTVNAGASAANPKAYSDISSDLVLLCVTDSAIESVAQELQFYKGITCHCSGTISMDVLKHLAHYGVLYPLQTLSKDHDTSLSDVAMLYEGSDNFSETAIQALALSISNKDVYADSETRLKYHLAAVWANNFGNLMAGIAEHLSNAYKLDFSLLKPLLLETANKLQHMSAREAQTGPARRNDEITMSKHLQLLAGEPGLQKLYTVLSKLIQQQ